MQITRLEIFGFKSFVERFVLNFDKDLIGVVGPNGCGKSNIVDALRWVLGETHAKQLRGSQLEDVIFNGSDSRRALGMAEVSITIRPDDGRLSANKAEEEEAHPDVLVLPVGKNSAPAGALSEAVDTEANGSLEHLVDAIPGILDVSEIQLTRRLYRSGESEYFINRVPCRLRDMSDLYRAIGLGPRGLSIVQQGQIGEIISKKPIERRELLEDAAGISGIRVRIEAAERQLEKTNTNIDRLSDIIREVEKQVGILRRQAKRAEQRKELRENLQAAELALFQHKSCKILSGKGKSSAQHAQLNAELEESSVQLEKALAEELRLKAELEACERERDQLQKQGDGLRDRLGQLLKERSQAQTRVVELETQLQGIWERLRLIDERKEAIGSETARRSEHIEQELAALERLAEEQERIAASKLQTEASFEAVERELEALSTDASALGRRLAELRVGISVSEKEASLLEERKETLLGEAEGKPTLRSVFTASSEEALMLEAALGLQANFLVEENLAQAFRAFEEEEGRYEKRFGVRCNSARAQARELPSQLEIEAIVPNAFYLTERFKVHPEYAELAGSVLNGVIGVENEAQAKKLAQSLGTNYPELRVVTTRGLVVSASGIENTDDKRSVSSIARALERVAGEQARLRGEFQQTEQEEALLRLELKQKTEEFRGEQRKYEQSQREALTRAVADVAAKEGIVAFERKRVAELREEIIELDNQRESLLMDERRLKSSIEQAKQQVTQAAQVDFQEDARVHEQLKAVSEQLAGVDAKRDELRNTLLEAEGATRALRDGLESVRSKISSSSLVIERYEMELSMLLEEMRARYGEQVVLPSEGDVQRFSKTPETEVEAEFAELNDNASALRRKLEREGEIDPESIERYQEEKERLEQLSTQREDLLEATTTLSRTIRELKEISRRRFLETFEVVNENFMRLVPRLFGGGAGHLELVDPEDPLTSGVALTVRPPGKKLRSMELLSGGEKALTAICILFAMFLHRPSPICVLDEVDAPLDEANLDRFMGVVRELAQRTQCLMITHNKKSMAEVDRLIGITMEEKGVSNALSVSLEQAEQAIEANA